MTTYELRFNESNSSTYNLKWYLQKVVAGIDSSTRYPTSGYIETASEINTHNTKSDILTNWSGGSIDLSSLMSIDSGAGLKIKIEDGRRSNVLQEYNEDFFNPDGIESFIIYVSDLDKKKENVIQSAGATVSFNMVSLDEPYIIMTDYREITGISQPFRRVQMYITSVCVPPSQKYQK